MRQALKVLYLLFIVGVREHNQSVKYPQQAGDAQRLNCNRLGFCTCLPGCEVVSSFEAWHSHWCSEQYTTKRKSTPWNLLTLNGGGRMDCCKPQVCREKPLNSLWQILWFCPVILHDDIGVSRVRYEKNEVKESTSSYHIYTYILRILHS